MGFSSRLQRDFISDLKLIVVAGHVLPHEVLEDHVEGSRLEAVASVPDIGLHSCQSCQELNNVARVRHDSVQNGQRKDRVLYQVEVLCFVGIFLLAS